MNFQLKKWSPLLSSELQRKTVIEDSKLGLRLFKDNTIAFDNVNKLPDGKISILTLKKLQKAEILKTKIGLPFLEKKILHQSLQRTFGYIESTQ